MFWGQRWLFDSGNIALLRTPAFISQWLGSDYMPAAAVVFFICLLFTVLWCVLATLNRFPMIKGNRGWALVWWIFGIFPLAASIIAAVVVNRLPDAQISLMLFFGIDSLILYWLSTALFSPEPVKYTPPGSFLIRHRLLGD